MNATDTFARFVEALAETLDDRAARNEAYAQRLHLSRFHFDRVVSATAGEPPATLRRRVLLERAAHRLLTTDDELLEVALSAGYSSHEAFTRAFHRAYGASPAAWRRTSSEFRIDAPNGVHYHPPGGLRLRAEKEVTEMELMTKMVEHHVWLLGEMVERAGALPADVLDRPIEISVEGIDDGPTTRSLLSRLVGQLAMWNAAVADRPYDFAVEREESTCSMKKRLAEEGPQFLATVRDADLDETFVDAVCDPPEVFTYGGMIAHVLTFSAHRRALVLGALADAGVADLGSGDPMKFVAA